MSKTYSEEFKQSMIKRMLPPESIPLTVLSKETGVSRSALHSWISKARGVSSAKSKFHIVVETYSMNEFELSSYCRQNGLFINDIKQWRTMFEQAELPKAALESNQKKSVSTLKSSKMKFVEKIKH